MGTKVPRPCATRWGTEMAAASMHYRVFDKYPGLLKKLENANKASEAKQESYRKLKFMLYPELNKEKEDREKFEFLK